MALRKFIRESAFRLARQDLALFLQDHEEDLLKIFREEMQQLDAEIPEENLFIDIKMVPLGEAILKSALHAIRRFLTEVEPGRVASDTQLKAKTTESSAIQVEK